MRSRNARRGAGLGSQTRNQAAVAWFWAAVGLQEVERGAVGYSPPPVLNYREGMGGEVVWWAVVGCAYLPGQCPSCFSFSSLPTPNSPYSPLIGCVTVVRGQLRSVACLTC